MRIGTITKLVYDKEYGSIQVDGGEEIHFHKHCLWDTEFKELREGQAVEFETQPSRKGFLGFHIRPHIEQKEFINRINHVSTKDKETRTNQEAQERTGL